MTENGIATNKTKSVQRYRIDLSYLGHVFQGWQTQPNGLSVQDYVQKALATFFRTEIPIIGASRTDSGVHAEHQVALFCTNRDFDPYKLVGALNALTPREMAITSISNAGEDFHPILSATGKAYRYRIWNSSIHNPFLEPFVWPVRKPLKVDDIRAGMNFLSGVHDFKSFCAKDSGAKTSIREIHEIFVDERGPLLDLWVVGNGFLKQMVRTIVGTLVEVGMGKRQYSDVSTILAACDRTAAGVTAPAQGLTLVKIFYGDLPTVKSLIERSQKGLCMAIPSWE